MQPIDYSLEVQSPFDQALKGFQTGLGLQDLQAKREAERQAQLQQQQMQADLMSASKDMTQIPGLMVRYPQLAEKLKHGWDAMNADQQKNLLSTGSEVLSALHVGRSDIAISRLKEQAQARRNAGDEQGAKLADDMATWAERDPDSLKTATALRLSALPGGEKMVSAITALGKEGRDIAAEPDARRRAAAEADKARADATTAQAGAAVATKAEQQKLARGEAEITNIKSQMTERGARLALDQERLNSEIDAKIAEFKAKGGTLPDDARKLVNESAAAAVTAETAAGQLGDLANRIEAQGGGYGAAASAAEWMAKATGKQDAMTALRQEYIRLRNTQAIKSLPPGPATDKDISLALAGFPPETADAKQLAGFLRGMGKLSRLDAASNTAKAEWVGSVGHLGKPKTDIEIDGVMVPAGTSFIDFSRMYLKKKDGEASAPKNTRSYMRFAQ